ncbi:SDR family oxidoreductase [Paenibacillus sp. N3.4]|uniref:SDR family oxidoreductase n=1 Tax=Paenibacillus sp. N3.4 TaxID=2603222 RepID=UPI0016501554|nr:SDR family oxidoreductase [Paenibacillus sp. N3.4]
MKVLVLGGTGNISRAIVARLLDQSHEVSIFNRGSRKLNFSDDVRSIVGDKKDKERFEAQMREESFDAVIDMISFNAEEAESTVRAFGGRTGHIVMCSSSSVYNRPAQTLPIREDEEELFNDPGHPYAYHKADMERYLRGVYERDKLPVTIIRPSLTYGPGGYNIGVLRQNMNIVERIRSGKPLVMFGDGTTPWSFTFASDLAKGFVGVLGNPATFGEAYHVTSEEPHIWEDLYSTFGEVLGKEPHIVHISSDLLMTAAPKLCSHLFYEKTYAGLYDNAKIKSVVPDYHSEVSLHAGIKMMIEWYEREGCLVDLEKDAFEDQLVQFHQSWSRQIANIYMK